MEAFKSILVPVNFSSISANAYRYALQLADHLSADLDLLYCVPPAVAIPGHGPFTVTFVDELEADAQLRMEEFVIAGEQGLTPKGKRKINVRSFIEMGDLRSVIRNQVSKMNNDLIVMGTHGRGDAWDELLGTNASFLVARAPCPVVIVPEGVPYRSLDRYCYATDLNHADVFYTTEVVKALKTDKPIVNYLHVRNTNKESTDFDLSLIREIFGRSDSEMEAHFTNLKNDDTVKAIFDYAADLSCSLVIMSRPERSWFERLIFKSTTRDAALRATIPLFIYGPEDLKNKPAKAKHNERTEA